MEFELLHVDVSNALASRQQPIIMVDRSKTVPQEDWIAAGPLNQLPRWVQCLKGEKSPVPLIGYMVSADAACLAAAGIELGARAMASLQQKKAGLPEKVILLLGSECHTVDGGWQYYAGFLARYGR